MGEHRNVRLNRTVKAVVLMVSDTRDFNTDKSGQCVRQLPRADDAEVSDTHYITAKDEEVAIMIQVREWLEKDIDVIITTGGAGTVQCDMTVEAVKPFLIKEIDGSGGLFRYLSYVEDADTCALLPRAVIGIVNNKLILLILGLAGTVKLALEELIKPELNHLIHELTK